MCAECGDVLDGSKWLAGWLAGVRGEDWETGSFSCIGAWVGDVVWCDVMCVHRGRGGGRGRERCGGWAGSVLPRPCFHSLLVLYDVRTRVKVRGCILSFYVVCKHSKRPGKQVGRGNRGAGRGGAKVGRLFRGFSFCATWFVCMRLCYLCVSAFRALSFSQQTD